MSSNRKRTNQLLIVFTRYPVPGKTKTRLVPFLGPVRAADLQRVLSERTVKTARRSSFHLSTDLEICFEGSDRDRVRRWLGPGPRYSRQEPGDLGVRMEGAFRRAFERGYRRVVLIGTDIPGLGSPHLEEAFHALLNRDLVLGPSTDGGYWLIGLRKPAPIFQGIPWGTETVLRDTLPLAAKAGLVAHRLGPLTDVDAREDLDSCMPGWAETGPFVSVIIPTFNEVEKIDTAVQSARDADAEVIVTDGGSRDGTVSRAEQAGARVVTGSRGRAVQQNRGAALAKGDILLFLHADTLLPENYVSHVFDTLLDPRVVLGAFRFRIDLDLPLMRIIEVLANARSRFLGMPYGDQGLFVRRTVFHAFGGFPEVPIGEDLFLVRRFGKSGRIAMAPACAVTSGRRWKALGPLKTTLINQVMVAGFLFGTSPHTLASLYRRHRKSL